VITDKKEVFLAAAGTDRGGGERSSSSRAGNRDQPSRGYGDETKGDETKIRKLWRNASHISFVESNNFRNFPRSGMGNKTKIK